MAEDLDTPEYSLDWFVSLAERGDRADAAAIAKHAGQLRKAIARADDLQAQLIHERDEREHTVAGALWEERERGWG